VGKSRASIANSMRLLELHPDVQGWLAQDRISVGHAKVLLSLKSPEEQLHIAELVIRQGHTVRATEKLVASHFANQGTARPTRSGGSPRGSALSPQFLHVQNRLQQHLATRVVLDHNEKRGRIEIEYYGKDDLQRILDVIGLGSE
jgi:ParB family chromosome partitioning protein